MECGLLCSRRYSTEPPASSSKGTTASLSSSFSSATYSSSSTGSSSSTVTSALSASSSTSAGGDGSSPSGEFFTGEATFYAPGLGSCGLENTNADFICALSKVLFDAVDNGNSNNNPSCKRKIFIRRAGSEKMLRRRGRLGAGRTEAVTRWDPSITSQHSLKWSNNTTFRSNFHRQDEGPQWRQSQPGRNPMAQDSQIVVNTIPYGQHTFNRRRRHKDDTRSNSMASSTPHMLVETEDGKGNAG